jgi:hypothetical protein
MSIGKVVKNHGAVVDVQFERHEMPKPYRILKNENDNLPQLEVQMILGGGIVRTIGYGDTSGLDVGMTVSVQPEKKMEVDQNLLNSIMKSLGGTNTPYTKEIKKDPIEKVSVFEEGIALFKVKDLIQNYFFDDNPWQIKEGNIILSDIPKFMKENSLRIQPGEYTDEDNDGRPMNVGDDGTQETHLARIAWLIDNWDDKKLCPLDFESGRDEPSFNNGIHRCFAMQAMGHDTARIKFSRGFKYVVENCDDFVSWEVEPSADAAFGQEVISNNSESFEVRSQEVSGKLWVSNNKGESVLRASLKGPFKSIEYKENNELKFITKGSINDAGVMKILRDKISPLFNHLENDFFSKLSGNTKDTMVNNEFN